MNIDINGNSIEITDSIREYAEKKIGAVEKLLHKGDRGFSAHAELGKSTNHHHKGDIFYTEITMHTAHKEHHVRADGEDLYKTIDESVHILEREIITHYGKRQSVWRRGAHKVKAILQGRLR